MLSAMVRKKLKIKTASEASTTASVVALPTPTAPSRVVRPLWQLMKTISSAKQNAFDRRHHNVAHLRPAHHVRHVIGPVDFEQTDRDEIAGDDSDADAFRDQQRHREHHRQRPRHDEIIDRMNRERAQVHRFVPSLSSCRSRPTSMRRRVRSPSARSETGPSSRQTETETTAPTAEPMPSLLN